MLETENQAQTEIEILKNVFQKAKIIEKHQAQIIKVLQSQEKENILLRNKTIREVAIFLKGRHGGFAPWKIDDILSAVCNLTPNYIRTIRQDAAKNAFNNINNNLKKS